MVGLDGYSESSRMKDGESVWVRLGLGNLALILYRAHSAETLGS
jgi:hypothetical protein